MNRFLYRHLTDGALRRGLLAAVPKSLQSYATAIAHIAEFDSRRLYAPEGYPSMSAFLEGELALSEQVAKKLIRVGRAGLRFPEIFLALGDGRLNASGVILLAPWLTRENARELLAAAAKKSNDEIRELLADRTPKMDVPLSFEAAPGSGEVSVRTPENGEVTGAAAGAANHAANSSMVSVRTPRPLPGRPKLSALGGGRYEARFTMGEAAREAIRYFEQLAGRAVTAEEFNEALTEGFQRKSRSLEKRRFGATDNPRKQSKPAHGRHIPNTIKREVWRRDEGRCTFVAENGRRCERRGDLEFDHIEPVAKGGKSTADNLRLLCRAHNQYEAERAFGAGFMHGKRERAKAAQGERGNRAAAAPGAAPVPTPARESGASARITPAGAKRAAPQAGARPRHDSDDVVPWLMKLGFRKSEAVAAASCCDSMPGASLEGRVKAALSYLAPPVRVDARGAGAAPQPPR